MLFLPCMSIGLRKSVFRVYSILMNCQFCKQCYMIEARLVLDKDGIEVLYSYVSAGIHPLQAYK